MTCVRMKRDERKRLGWRPTQVMSPEGRGGSWIVFESIICGENRLSALALVVFLLSPVLGFVVPSQLFAIGTLAKDCSETEGSVLNPTPFTMTLMWQGAETKPVPELRLACQANQKELTQWVEKWRWMDKAFNVPKRQTRILSKKEVRALEALLRTARYEELRCAEEEGTGRQGYVIKIRRAAGITLYELGSGGKALDIVEEIRDRLEKPSQAAFKGVIEYLRRLVRISGERTRQKNTRTTPKRADAPERRAGDEREGER